MGGQVHGPNLGMAPRLGYRRSDEDTEQNERLVLSHFLLKRSYVTSIEFIVVLISI